MQKRPEFTITFKTTRPVKIWIRYVVSASPLILGLIVGKIVSEYSNTYLNMWPFIITFIGLLLAIVTIIIYHAFLKRNRRPTFNTITFTNNTININSRNTDSIFQLSDISKLKIHLIDYDHGFKKRGVDNKVKFTTGDNEFEYFFQIKTKKAAFVLMNLLHHYDKLTDLEVNMAWDFSWA